MKLCITFLNLKVANDYHTYQLNNHSVSRISEIKDLGVIFDSALSFKSHYSYIFKKSLQIWGLIWRNCKDLSPVALKTLFCSLVCSHLEYCSSIWLPIYHVDSELLEKVQKRFLRTLEYKLGRRHNKGDYQWIMNKFNIQTLSVRRQIADACVLHGIINGYIDNPDLLAKLSFVVPAVDSRSTRNLSIFRIPPATTNFSANHPLRRIMEAANGYIKRKEVCLFSFSKAVFKNKTTFYYRH